MTGATEATLSELLEIAKLMNINLVNLNKLTLQAASGSGSSSTGPASAIGKANIALTALSSAASLVSGVFNIIGNIVGKVITGFANTAANLINFSKAAIQGTAKLSDFYNAFKDLPFFVGNVASFFRDIISYSENLLEVYRNLTNVGASFGGNLVEMRAMAARTGLTLTEFAGIISKNSQLFASMGGNVQAGINKFVDTQSKLLDPSGPYAKGLLSLGVTAEESAELLTTVMSSQGAMGKKNAASTDELAKMTSAYIAELDTLSKLTGQRREQIDAEIKKAKEDQAWQLFMDSLNPEQGKKVQSMLAQAAAAQGQAGVDQLKASLRGIDVPLTEAARNLAIASNGTSLEMYARLRGLLYDQSVSAAEIEKRGMVLQYRVAEAVGKTAESFGKELLATPIGQMFNAASLQIYRNIRAAGGNIEAAMNAALADQIKQGKGGAAALATAQQNIRKFGNTLFEAIAVFLNPLITKLSAWGEGLTSWLANTASESTGAVSKVWNFVENSVMPKLESMAKWFQTTFEMLGNASGKDFWSIVGKRTVEGFKNIWNEVKPVFVTIFNEVKPVMLDAIKNIFEFISDALNDWIYKKTGGLIGENPADRIERQRTMQTPEFNAWLEKMKNQGNMLQRRQAEFGSDKDIFAMYQAQLPKRASGSLGATGSFFENWGKGKTVELHGTEGVITPDQMSSIIASAVSATQAENNVTAEVKQLNNLTMEMIKELKLQNDLTSRNIDAVRSLNGNLFSIA